MSGYIRIQDSLNEKYAKETGFTATFMTTMPSVVYTIVILILNNLYLRAATMLNDWGKNFSAWAGKILEQHSLASKLLFSKCVFFSSQN
jgi:hypothetical protein